MLNKTSIITPTEAISAATIEVLNEAGFHDYDDLAGASTDELTEIGIDVPTAEKLIMEARALPDTDAMPTEPAPAPAPVKASDKGTVKPNGKGKGKGNGKNAEPEKEPESNALFRSAFSETLPAAKNLEGKYVLWAQATVAFLNERLAAANGNGKQGVALQVTYLEIRRHAFSVVGYEPGNPEAKYNERSAALEVAATRGIRAGVLAFEGWQGCALVKDDVTGAVQFVAPYSTQVPKLVTLDPQGRKLPEIDNTDATVMPVTQSRIEEIFKRRFPGTTRKATQKGTGDKTATVADILARVKLPDVMVHVASMLAHLNTKAREENQFPTAETMEYIEAVASEAIELVTRYREMKEKKAAA